MGKTYRFSFKRLKVYEAAVEHFAWAADVVGRNPRLPFKVSNQVVGTPLSVLSNVAEASGREKEPGEALQHYRYAQASTFECAAQLDALAALELIDDEEYNDREQSLAEISSMLSGLTRRHQQRRSRREQSERPASAASLARAKPEP